MSADQQSAHFAPFGWSQSWNDARLDTKFLVSLVSVGLLAAFLTFAMLAAVILPRFANLEGEQVASHFDRTKAVLDEYSMRVETAVKDYAAWDDSYKYVRKPDPAFAAETLSILAMSNLDVNGMAYVRNDGTVLASNWINIAKGVEDPALGHVFDDVLSRPDLLALVKQRESVRYFAKIGQKIAAFSAARVVKTDGSGEPNGFVVMARELSSKQLSDLLQIYTQLSVNDRKPAQQVAEYEDRIDIAVDVQGLSGRIGQAKFSIPRRMLSMGHDTLLYAGLGGALVLTFVMFILRRLMRSTVARRLLDVEQHLASVALSGQLAPLEVPHSNDEIGSLVDHLNDMLIQLKDLREQVEIQSFKLGKTESAVGVMHNVRNGLNPVSVILARSADYSTAVSVADVARAVEELQDPATVLERRVKLASFLRVALTAQLELRQEGQQEIETARRCLAEVVDMIGQQQELAHAAVETELCDLGEVIRQNAALARYAKSHSVEFRLSDERHLAQANRILLSQVVGNLFANAVEAITSASRSKGLVEVSYVNEAPWLEIRVRDNGDGFEAGTVKRFFERGFSTRKEKSGGLGLHWCANALSLMNGQLELVSDGPGLGATAIIRLPEASHPGGQNLVAGADKVQSHPDHGNAVAKQALRS